MDHINNKYTNNSKFFCNKDCAYYPCHDIANGQELNCLFCYCPLYFKKNCPGNPSYIIASDGSRIKDCSGCLFPHMPDNYDRVIAELMNNEINIEVTCAELYDNAYRYVMACSGYDSMDEEAAQIQKSTADDIYNRYFRDKCISVSLKKIEKECMHDGYFTLGKEKLKCQVLGRFSHSIIKCGYIYTCHAPEAEETDSILEQYYIEVWQNSLLDSMRDFLHDYIERKESVRRKSYVTDSFGPGFYGMEISAVNTLAKIMKGNKAGVKLNDSGNLSPAKSLIGIYLVMNEDIEWQIRDCISCVGNGQGCKFCYGYKGWKR